MTNKNTKYFVMAIPLLLILASVPSAFADEWAYQATNPTGGEIVEIRGDFVTYRDRLDTSPAHIDTIAYITNISDFSVGIGYYDYTSGGTEYYKWVRYWDEGATYNNLHYLASTGPTSESTKTWGLWEVDSDSYDFQIGSTTFTELHCHGGDCPDPTIAGVASWSTGGDDTDDTVKAWFSNLELDTTGSDLDPWSSQSSDYKCADVGTDFDKVSGSIDEVKFDFSGDECSSNVSSWLYNGGDGG